MIAIVNISPKHTPAHGLNQYALKSDRVILCTFWHIRTCDSKTQLLIDAAEAYKNYKAEKSIGEAA
ncbi:hypothetical protein [Paraglaciecola psychrophila]|uniref:Uncharacterized protein n=1 Tax=Paraglaciecola psychrophila 170 TaxID=1129794 RepID=K6YVU1_9ALTE|nr:hypothetical protein [Paraglaciecola psychrophila]AGH44510.1 hypothetical protein C427_2401 [Paraglaciecola psychrophila 170]GAC36814.1 hypothetical protein GPSY_1177 [Paraglaciecola psychrophila 170]